MKQRKQISLIAGAALAAMGAALAVVLLPVLAQATESAGRVHGAPALKQVGQAVGHPATTGILARPRSRATEGGNFVLADGGCKDLATGLVWSASARFTLRTNSDWRYAMSYCDQLVEGGYSDWRAPTVAELQQVAADGAASHLDIFPAHYDKVWSSTTKGKNAYSVVFNDGDPEFADREPDGLVELHSKYNYIDVVAVRRP